MCHFDCHHRPFALVKLYALRFLIWVWPVFQDGASLAMHTTTTARSHVLQAGLRAPLDFSLQRRYPVHVRGSHCRGCLHAASGSGSGPVTFMPVRVICS